MPDTPTKPLQRLQSAIPLILLSGTLVGGFIEGVRKIERIESTIETNRKSNEQDRADIAEIKRELSDNDKGNVKRDAELDQLVGHTHSRRRNR